MPRKVDHEERRRLIADALMRVAAEHGLEAVSLRHVAAEAGVTAGMVQHYFRTKDEMMTFALAVIRERGEERLGGRLGALGADPAPRDLLRTMIAGVLPTDEPSRAIARVALAFCAYAALRPDTSGLLRTDNAALIEHVADLVRAAQATGDAVAHLDPTDTAIGLLALMEGLGLHLILSQYPPESAIAAIDAHLALIFPP